MASTIMETIVMKNLFSILLGIAALSLSSIVSAWDAGPCQGAGAAPCIEAEVSGNIYHINGNGGGAGTWYGLPTTGEDFQFTGPLDWSCDALDFSCTLTLRGKVQKCQDANGSWRLGMQINSSDMSGAFICGTVEFGGFPWYATDTSIANHCPFTNSCDNFVPYVAGAPSISLNMGLIDMTVLFIPRVVEAHMHDVVLTYGTGASIEFNSGLFDCSEASQGCSFIGWLSLNNADFLKVY